jgi:hypothetical protein
LPSRFLDLAPEEKAFIVAAIDIRCEDEKKEQAKIKSASKGG